MLHWLYENGTAQRVIDFIQKSWNRKCISIIFSLFIPIVLVIVLRLKD